MEPLEAPLITLGVSLSEVLAALWRRSHLEPIQSPPPVIRLESEGTGAGVYFYILASSRRCRVSPETGSKHEESTSRAPPSSDTPSSVRSFRCCGTENGHQGVGTRSSWLPLEVEGPRTARPPISVGTSRKVSRRCFQAGFPSLLPPHLPIPPL